MDSTGIKFLDEGEWLACRHGTHRHRQYRKVHHLAMDTATDGICAVEFISSNKGDSPVLPHLLHQTPPDEQIGTHDRRWREVYPAATVRNQIVRAIQCRG